MWNGPTNNIFVTGKYRDLQRVTLPYARILGIIDEAAADEQQLRAELQAGGQSANQPVREEDEDERME